ncbi:unnamed protein product [Amoebophrya sp. A25]|nr:unnamed protein product [Amoebophrya sp. A25]|eukprot:GSA25T00027003001.1
MGDKTKKIPKTITPYIIYTDHNKNDVVKYRSSFISVHEFLQQTSTTRRRMRNAREGTNTRKRRVNPLRICFKGDNSEEGEGDARPSPSPCPSPQQRAQRRRYEANKKALPVLHQVLGTTKDVSADGSWRRTAQASSIMPMHVYKGWQAEKGAALSATTKRRAEEVMKNDKEGKFKVSFLGRTATVEEEQETKNKIAIARAYNKERHK